MKYAVFFGILLFLAVAGCQSKQSPAVKQYDVVGKVVLIGGDKKSVTLDHKDIPGLMQAMEMEFKVNDPQVLGGVGEGDQVKGQLEVRSGEYVITSLSKQ